eukprot:4734930-Ditylum_brightwellii.AAC.1
MGLSLHDRLNRLGKELGFVSNGPTFIANVLSFKQKLSPTKRDEIEETDISCAGINVMSELEDDIQILISRVDEMQGNNDVVDNEKSRKATAKTLSDKLSSLEGDLVLKHKNNSLLPRIRGLEENMDKRILKLERLSLEKSQIDEVDDD